MIKYKRPGTSFIRILFAVVTSISIMPLLACSDNGEVKDFIAITGVNTYFSGADAARNTKTLETTIRVKISHSSHEKADVRCETCHHKKGNDERIKKCAYCHKGLSGAKMFHKSCVKCHTDKNKGPVRCNECHIEKQQNQVYKDIENMYGSTFVFNEKSHKSHEKSRVECNLCHHDAGNEKDKKKCNVCHVGKSGMVIFHSFCKDCHKKNDGPVKCQQCHAGVKSEYQNVQDVIPLDKTGRRLPRIQFNHKGHVEKYNTECVDCHHLGSTKKCSSCHGKKDAGAVINLKAAFHQQCHECHRRVAGPQGCHSCHMEKK